MSRDYEVDLGVRCERHVGEVFPPRCQDCDLATLEAPNAPVQRHLDRNPPPDILATARASHAVRRSFENAITVHAFDADTLDIPEATL
ncbi:MAG: hypothetical protein JWQ47_2279 [Glaciihabitans sp.]|nr:hypothetical protein [Glaciihabitans sp.]